MKKLILIIALVTPLVVYSQSLSVTRVEAERMAMYALHLTHDTIVSRQQPVVSNTIEKKYGDNIILYEFLFESGESTDEQNEAVARLYKIWERPWGLNTVRFGVLAKGRVMGI